MDPAVIVAIVFISGFAIQHLLQFIDPLVIGFMNWLKASRPNKDLPCVIPDADFKKSLMAFLSFLLGLIVVYKTNIRLLELLDKKYQGIGDFLITSLVVGSGTEATNTILKFLGYVKDAQKPPATVSVTILTTTVTVQKNQTFQFTAVVKNTDNQQVEWSVLHGSGGTITPGGLYTAPPSTGKTIVMAASKADPTQRATATVTVV